ncbi:hypothetical protein ACJ2A9_03925 [Anaerobacillus sp. MEB173]|uniref:hypothetical protein n=1 Tax=Anaerobacillus sp. MEB173 TaxID=3383345 RepID=UPI003F92FCB2
MEGWLFDWWPIVAIGYLLAGYFIVKIEVSRGENHAKVVEQHEQQSLYHTENSFSR